jgi:hypothetical protein
VQTSRWDLQILKGKASTIQAIVLDWYGLALQDENEEAEEEEEEEKKSMRTMTMQPPSRNAARKPT